MGDISTVTAILNGLAIYAGLGALFAALFLAFGLTHVDHGAKGAGLAFRLMIVPGLVALWPIMLVRWIVGGQPHGD
jgi:hypothetical protein